ncbi:MAG: TatD-related deoxyribonuclease, partial [uncultured bacterium]
MLIDTHTHLDFQSFNDDREEVLARAKDTGVEKMINCGSAWEGSLASVELSEKYPQVFAAVGLHPHETAYAKKNLNYISKLEELADNDKVVAIGEIGLDYFEMANIKEEQKELFIPQLELAEKLGLPVILHARDSYADVYEIVKDKKLKAVLHCFSGDLKQAEKFLNLGFMISFTGIITFAKTDKLV